MIQFMSSLYMTTYAGATGATYVSISSSELFERGSVPAAEKTSQDQKRQMNQKLPLRISSCDHFHYSASEWRRLAWNALVKRYGYLNITMDTSVAQITTFYIIHSGS